MGFGDNDIQHFIEDGIKFFNTTYGLDFFLSPPNEQNEQNEYFFENAKMFFYRVPQYINYQVVLSNWIQTGSTRLTCHDIYQGGFRVIFTGEQPLHGSYGGVNGIPADVQTVLVYGLYTIDICDQSPVIIQFQTATPGRREPVDGAGFLNFDVYNNVLGHGKAIGTQITLLSKKFRSQIVFTFPNAN